MPAAWSIAAHEFCWCVSGRDKANHSPRLSAHLLLEPLRFVSHPVLERQTVSRRAIKPSDIRGAVCEHRSSGQVGWSRRLTQAAGMPPRPVCELVGAGPLAGGLIQAKESPPLVFVESAGLGGDEANYFCQSYSRDKWNNFTFLSVKDPNDQRFVSQTVVQQPVSASAQLGDPVALQCSITSQRTDHSNQCQREPSVYWFRSGPSHPAAVYMNGNRSGTYYCALAACGEVVFGSGTQLDITETNWRLFTMVLGILLACCLAVIIILFLTRNTKYVCDHREGTLSASNQVPHDSGNQEQQDGETDSLNYAALEFSGRKTRGRKKNSERTQESVYSAVRETCQ
ncbi:unnamed protein product [Boreogadus saida]